MNFETPPSSRGDSAGGPWSRLGIRGVLVAVVLLPLLTHFSRPLLEGDQFAFRDVAHYYFPLYQRTSAYWQTGHIPAWNPHENTGQPLAADSTAAVFYPGQVLFLLPIPFERVFPIYVVGHLVLAALLMGWASRQFGQSLPAATLAALVYASGGYVLFLYCNLAYLIGAAWLPLGFLAGHQVIQVGGWRWAKWFSISLALMVLGGDAQTAYHLAFITAAFGCYAWYSGWRRGEPAPGPRQFASWGSGLALAALLAAVQIGPSVQWARHATRTQHDRSLSLWHWLGNRQQVSAEREGITSLLRNPHPGTHDADIYGFSVGPWRAAELIWPNFSGKIFPTNHRWTRPVFGERRIWNPSLYLGWLPIVLAILAFRRRTTSMREGWWGWLALLSLLASLGEYGLIWCLARVASWSPLTVDLNDVGGQVGGLYWWFVVLLPGYSSFRYPAKWLVIFSVSISFLAAAGLDHLLRQASRKELANIRRGLLTTFFLSLGGLILLLVVRTTWLQAYLPAADPLFGPLQPTGAFRDLARSLLHHMVVALLLLGGFQLAISGKSRGLLAGALLLVTAADLAVAHHWQVVTAPGTAICSSTAHQQIVANAERRVTERGESDLAENNLDGRAVRIYRGTARRWRPRSWAITSHQERLEELLRWNQDSLHSKYPLLAASPSVSVLESVGSMHSADFASLRRVARRVGPMRSDGERELPSDVLEILGAEWLLIPSDADLGDYWRKAGYSPVQALDGVENVTLWRNSRPHPRAWIVRQWDARDLRDSVTSRDRDAWTRQLLFPSGRLRDLKNQVVLELAKNHPARGSLARLSPSSDGPRLSEACHLVKGFPERLEFHIDLEQPGILVVSDLYYPGWECEVIHEVGAPAGTRIPILRANRTMRAVLLDRPGSQRVVFRYRPWLLHGCLLISVASWVLLLGSALYLIVGTKIPSFLRGSRFGTNA